MAQLKVTYVKSTIGYAKDQKATVRSLGLRKLHQSVIHEDTPVIRGMAFKVRHLVKIEEIDGAVAQPSGARRYAAPTGTAEPRTSEGE
jgi:large subunit ribosomal protein L30